MMIKLMCILFSVVCVGDIQTESKHKTEVSKEVVKEAKTTQRHIKDFILTVKKNEKFAEKVSQYIMDSSEKYHIDPYWILTTAYVESELSMNSRPCVGIMQVEMKTYREVDRKTGLDPYDLRDNIYLGARELARYYYNPKLRNLDEKSKIRHMWGRYNGAGANSGYVTKSLKVYNKIINGDADEWKQILHKRPLFK